MKNVKNKLKMLVTALVVTLLLLISCVSLAGADDKESSNENNLLFTYRVNAVIEKTTNMGIFFLNQESMNSYSMGETGQSSDGNGVESEETTSSGWTCLATCDTTCAGLTCFGTCNVTCMGLTCGSSTCYHTCPGLETCDPTCVGLPTCGATTCNATCHGQPTCYSTCQGLTCWDSCDPCVSFEIPCIGPADPDGPKEPVEPPENPYCKFQSMAPGGVTCFGWTFCVPSYHLG